MTEEKQGCIVAVRIRGNVGLRPEVKKTLGLMHLPKRNHSTIIINTPSQIGMLQKVKDYITWGEATPETIHLLLRERGKIVGGEDLTDDYATEKLKYGSLRAFADAIAASGVEFWKTPGVKPVFRLHPPKGGFRKSVKKPYPNGELGFRGKDINGLIEKMV